VSWRLGVIAAWTWLLPAAAALLLGVAVATGGAGAPLLVLCAIGLGGAVIAAVHHAEVIAHRIGEPFGTLMLALAVTVIEASLILSMMVAGGAEMAVLPRDAIYAAVMIICNGVVGLCLLIGGLAHGEQSFRIEGAGAGLAALIVMSSMSLVLPDFTTSTPSGTFTRGQLLFVAVTSAALWAIFVFFQTVRHRDYFLPSEDVADADGHSALAEQDPLADAADTDRHLAPPTRREAWTSFALLMVSLVAVVGLAKTLSPAIERIVLQAGAPRAVVGVMIAMLVLLPESLAATRAARANRLQTGMNLAIGSALASIGLTIPVVALAVIVFDLPLVLGLDPKELALLTITFIVTTITLGSGRTNMMQGAVHLVLFAVFVFLAVIP